MRYKLTVHGRRERLLLVEEAQALAFGPTAATPMATGTEALAWLDHEAAGDLSPTARLRLLEAARIRLQTEVDEALARFANARAESLAEDHDRLRAAIAGVSRVSVEPVLPTDIIGLFVLVPAAD
jgi:hypothetical protein